MAPPPVPEFRVTWTLKASGGLVWVTWPAHVPPREAGIVGLGVGDACGRVLAAECAGGVEAVGWPAALGCALSFCAAWMATAMARTQTVIPAAHQTVTPRAGPRRGGRSGRGSGAGSGGRPARAARRIPSPRTPASGVSLPSRSVTTDLAVGRSLGPGEKHLVTTLRSGSGSRSRPSLPAGLPA